MKFILLFTVSVLCAVTSFAKNNIEPPQNNRVRCSDKPYPPEECQEDRDAALKSGCIDGDDLRKLVEYGGCPLCDRRNEYRGWCAAGCFVRGTKILVLDIETDSQIWIPIEDVIARQSQYKIVGLKKGVTVSSLEFAAYPIRLSTVGPEHEPLVVPEHEPLVVIKTENQRTLGITKTHRIMLASGMLVPAEMLNKGDQIVAEDGSVDTISEISNPLTDDDVFNLSVETDDIESHLILAEGLLVGDQYLQSLNGSNIQLIGQ